MSWAFIVPYAARSGKIQPNVPGPGPAMSGTLPIDEILASRPPLPLEPGGSVRPIGRSRRGRPLLGVSIGTGRLPVSLIAGAHADEPVGPESLHRLSAWLRGLPADHPILCRHTFRIVPHVNPDGAAANASWPGRRRPLEDHLRAADHGFLLSSWLRGAVREPPGDDLEFGFPREPGDEGARPEARALADFLRPAAPYVLHASLHSMAFGAGPWFLLDRAWIDRTAGLRRELAARTAAMGYRLHDVDRGGEKGFTRIERGFCTRPDSESMRRHFEEQGDRETASRFRPSSMEHVRSLGGDALTVVSEMPLFLVPAREEVDGIPMPLDPESRKGFLAWAERMVREQGDEALESRATELGIRPMPIRDQMRLQLELVSRSLAAATS